MGWGGRWGRARVRATAVWEAAAYWRQQRRPAMCQAWSAGAHCSSQPCQPLGTRGCVACSALLPPLQTGACPRLLASSPRLARPSPPTLCPYVSPQSCPKRSSRPSCTTRRPPLRKPSPRSPFATGLAGCGSQGPSGEAACHTSRCPAADHSARQREQGGTQHAARACWHAGAPGRRSSNRAPPAASQRLCAAKRAAASPPGMPRHPPPSLPFFTAPRRVWSLPSKYQRPCHSTRLASMSGRGSSSRSCATQQVRAQRQGSEPLGAGRAASAHNTACRGWAGLPGPGPARAGCACLDPTSCQASGKSVARYSVSRPDWLASGSMYTCSVQRRSAFQRSPALVYC